MTGQQLYQIYFNTYVARGAEITVWDQLYEVEQAVWDEMAAQVTPISE